jgi:hypothetical protein
VATSPNAWKVRSVIAISRFQLILFYCIGFSPLGSLTLCWTLSSYSFSYRRALVCVSFVCDVR